MVTRILQPSIHDDCPNLYVAVCMHVHCRGHDFALQCAWMLALACEPLLHYAECCIFLHAGAPTGGNNDAPEDQVSLAKDDSAGKLAA